MITFLYFCCIEIALIYLLNVSKEFFKKYLIVCLLSNCLINAIASTLLLQDVLFLEVICFFLFYFLDRNITEILFYLSFSLVIKDIVLLLPFYEAISFIAFMIIVALMMYIKHFYPIDNQNMYWGLLMLISISTLCVYHILYYDFLDVLGVNRNLIILATLVLTIIFSYYLFFRYTKLYHEQQLLNQAVNYFKNDQQNYAFIEKKNNELNKLKHDLKYEYLQMKEYVKRKEFETVNQMIDQKVASLDQEEMIITSGNKLFDAFVNMKLEQLKLEHITPTMIISIQDISFINDEHLNIIISYLFDIAMNCIQNNELEIKAIQDECVFEIAIFISQGIENIDRMKYDTLKLILKKYQGSIKIIHENQNINISLLIPVSR